MDHIHTEARRVPLWIQLLGLARRHAADHALNPAMAIEDVRITAGRLSAHDLTGAEPPLTR
jgi:hypothetical protein